MLLDNKVFGVDYKLPEFKTFAIVTSEDFMYMDWDKIKTDYPEYVNRIMEAIKNDIYYISIGNINKPGYFEIQWD